MRTHAQELQKEYSRLTDIAKARIREVMGPLSEGKLPAPASVDSLEAAVSALRNKENEINALVLEDPVFEDPDLPLKRRRIARILLQRFARIQSPMKGYAKALGPYQRQALELLPTVDNYTELQDIERLTTGPRLFFRALEIINEHPYLPYDLEEALKGFYSERVLLGLLGRKYSLSTEDTDADREENRALEKLGYDPSFVIIEDVLMEYVKESPDEIIVIPPWVREIDGLAFRDCRNAKRILIPDSVQKIGFSAFHNAGFVSIVIPDSVTELRSEAFSDCSNLRSVVIGKGITELEYRTFESCQRLDHLELPATLKRVGSYAFERCYPLKTVWVDGREYSLRDPEAPKPVKLVLDCLEEITDRIKSDYENGLMDEFEYVDYNIAGDGYSY